MLCLASIPQFLAFQALSQNYLLPILDLIEKLFKKNREEARAWQMCSNHDMLINSIFREFVVTLIWSFLNTTNMFAFCRKNVRVFFFLVEGGGVRVLV